MKPYTYLAYSWYDAETLRSNWRCDGKHCQRKKKSHYAKRMFRARAKRDLIAEVNGVVLNRLGTSSHY